MCSFEREGMAKDNGDKGSGSSHTSPTRPHCLHFARPAHHCSSILISCYQPLRLASFPSIVRQSQIRLSASSLAIRPQEKKHLLQAREQYVRNGWTGAAWPGSAIAIYTLEMRIEYEIM